MSGVEEDAGIAGEVDSLDLGVVLGGEVHSPEVGLGEEVHTPEVGLGEGDRNSEEGLDGVGRSPDPEGHRSPRSSSLLRLPKG